VKNDGLIVVGFSLQFQRTGLIWLAIKEHIHMSFNVAVFHFSFFIFHFSLFSE